MTWVVIIDAEPGLFSLSFVGHSEKRKKDEWEYFVNGFLVLLWKMKHFPYNKSQLFIKYLILEWIVQDTDAVSIESSSTLKTT